VRTGTTRLLLTLLGVLALAAGARAQTGSIASIAPASASYGQSVTITGNGFGGPNVEIRVGGVRAPVVSATGSRATFRVPAGVPIGPTTVTATNPGGRTGAIRFEILSLVTLTFDNAHRVEAAIGRDGGVISTQSNGRTFTLMIPPGALAAPEVIVLTPIASMTGFPLERLVGSVHFAPEGLQFFEAATLTITVPPSTNTKGLIGFSAAGNGENLHLAPFTMTDDHAISIPIPHFTVGGAGGGSPGAVTTVNCQQATLECTYVNALGQAQQQALQTVCGTDCATPDELAAHMGAIEQAFLPQELALIHQWFTAALNLLNTTGGVDDAGLTQAGREYLSWKAWVQASSCGVNVLTCKDIPDVAADIQQGDEALGQAYLAAFQRAHAGCNDRRVFGLLIEIDTLRLLGKGGLPADFGGVRELFACQLVVTPTFPTSVHMNDSVPFTVEIGLRSVGGGNATPLAGTTAQLEISDGCGLFLGGVRSGPGVTAASGVIATTVNITTPCINTLGATEVTVRVADILDGLGQLVAFGRDITVRATIAAVVNVTPGNQSVNPGGVVTFTAQVQGAGPLVTWTATGGSITPGPSATATYTAGSTPGVFSVTATSVDAPSSFRTVTVTITDPPGIVLRSQSAGISSDAAGACTVLFNSFHQPLSSCPGGTRPAPAGFTEFHQQQRTFAVVAESTETHGQHNTDGKANLDVSFDDEDGVTSIVASGSTSSAIHDYPEAPASSAEGTASFSVQIEIRGRPVSYRLVGTFFSDSLAHTSDIGFASVSFEFATEHVQVGPFIPDGSPETVDLNKTGTLQPGTYTLSLDAASASLFGRSVGFHTQWGFRLELEQQ
jgi:hypothetical protein